MARTLRHSALTFPVRLHMADGSMLECPKRSIFDMARAEQIQGLSGRTSSQYAAIWCALQRVGAIPKVLFGPDALGTFFGWLETVEDAEDFFPEPEETQNGEDPTKPD